MPFPLLVIPAKAGNQGGWGKKLDPGFRRGDGVGSVHFILDINGYFL
jgi:hypothetical protein